MSRVKLFRNDEAPDKSKEIFEKIESNGATVLNLYRAVGHSPSTIAGFIKLGNVLLNRAELPPKLREIAILRIANLTGSEYEWTQHVPIALEVGVTQQQIDDIAKWKDSKTFDPVEKTVLQYTDEVAQDITVKNETYNVLKEFLNERCIVELTVSIGYWGMIARVLVPLEIDIEAQSVGSATDLLGKKKDGA